MSFIIRYGDISIGDTVDEFIPTGDGLILHRTFVVTRIYRDRDMDGNIITMIGDDEESVINHFIKKKKKI